MDSSCLAVDVELVETDLSNVAYGDGAPDGLEAMDCSGGIGEVDRLGSRQRDGRPDRNDEAPARHRPTQKVEGVGDKDREGELKGKVGVARPECDIELPAGSLPCQHQREFGAIARAANRDGSRSE